MKCLKRLIANPAIIAIQLKDNVFFLILLAKSSEKNFEIGRNHSKHQQKFMFY